MELEFERKPFAPSKEPQEMKQLILLEKTKIADKIFMKYDVKAVDLIRATQENQINEAELQSLRKSILDQQLSKT